MRLLIVGALEGQLSEATKLAMDGGARVAHARTRKLAPLVACRMTTSSARRVSAPVVAPLAR